MQKISLLTPNIGVTYSGMGPDSRVLVRKARKSGQVRGTRHYPYFSQRSKTGLTAAGDARLVREHRRMAVSCGARGRMHGLWGVKCGASAEYGARCRGSRRA